MCELTVFIKVVTPYLNHVVQIHGPYLCLWCFDFQDIFAV